jgi:cytochrome c
VVFGILECTDQGHNIDGHMHKYIRFGVTLIRETYANADALNFTSLINLQSHCEDSEFTEGVEMHCLNLAKPGID